MSLHLTFDQISYGLETYRGGSSDYMLNEGLLEHIPRAKRPASVLIPLVSRPEGVMVIFTRRTSHLKYHAGQISFPGGKAEHWDRDELGTALREAKEEIGLDPAQVEVLGVCPPHETVTGFRITPFVGKVDPLFDAMAQIEEVAEIFEVSLDFLMDLTNYRIESIMRDGKKYRYIGLNYHDYHIWGATARILNGLARHLNERCE